MSKMVAQDLSHLSLFQGLNPAQLALIEPLLEVCDYTRDTVIFEQDDPAQFLYIVSRGEVVVLYKAYDGPVITVARVGVGGVFGWSSALGRTTYSSGAVCSQDTMVYRVSGKGLQRLCDQVPETGIIILERLANLIDERLCNTHSQIMDILTHGVDGSGDCMRRINQNGHDPRA
jgi:CRP-like cAMP-binding protein